MAIVDADYGSMIETLRGHLAFGTSMSAGQMKTCIALIQDAITRFDDNGTALEAVVTALTPLDEAELTAEPAASAAIIAGLIEDLNDATISVPTYVVNTLADG